MSHAVKLIVLKEMIHEEDVPDWWKIICRKERK